MSIKIEIYDGAIPMLKEIAEANYGMALDALEHAGIILRDSTRKAFTDSTTAVSQYYDENGNLNIKRQGGKIAQTLGQRISHRNKGSMDSTASMKSFITSNLMAKNMTMVVAGKHKRLRHKIRRDGKVEAYAKTVDPVTKGSYAILQKLDSGDRNTDDGDYKNKVLRKRDSIFENMKLVKQDFIKAGRANAMGRVKSIMTDKLEKLITREINRANVTIKEVKRA